VLDHNPVGGPRLLDECHYRDAAHRIADEVAAMASPDDVAAGSRPSSDPSAAEAGLSDVVVVAPAS